MFRLELELLSFYSQKLSKSKLIPHFSEFSKLLRLRYNVRNVGMSKMCKVAL